MVARSVGTSAPAPRILPALTDENRDFWSGGAHGALLIQWCHACQRWQHPPHSSCHACSGPVNARKVSGLGTVFTYTENFQPYHPDVPPPYIIAIVELAEQSDLRIPTNIINCDHDAVRCGLEVRVLFERHHEIFVPVFEPTGPDASRRASDDTTGRA